MKSIVVLIAVATGLACSASSSGEAPQAAPPTWEQRLSAEAEDQGREQPVHDIAGRFAAKVRTTGAPSMSRSEGFTEVYWPIGAGMKVECLVFDTRKEAAALVRTFEQILLKGAARVVRREVGAGQIASRPFVSLHTEYAGEQDARGLLKLMAMHTGDGTVLCAHDEPGYAVTYLGAVEHFIKSLSFAKSGESNYRYRDVFEVRVRGNPIGFIESWIGALPKGNERFIQSTSLLIANGEALDAHDLLRIETSDSKGALAAGTYAAFSNGELQSSLELAPVAKGYKLAGKKKGQAVEETITMKPLVGELGMNRAVAAQMKRPSDRANLNVFSTSTYQGVFATISVGKSVATGAPLVRVELDTSVIEGPADATGRFEKATITNPSGKTELKRLLALDP